MKPLFSSKGSYNTNIKLTDKDEIIQNDKKVAETLKSFFENGVSSLKLNKNSFVNELKNIQDPIKKIIIKLQFHANILIIKNIRLSKINYQKYQYFLLQNVILPDVKIEIKGLNPNKETTHNNIPSKILRTASFLKI